MKLIIMLILPLFLFTGIFLLAPEMRPAVQGIEQSSAQDNFTKFCAGCHGSRMERFAGKTWEAYSSGTDLSTVIRY